MGIELEIGEVTADPPIERGYDVIIRLDFDVSLVLDGSRIWSENICAVELAVLLARWLRSVKNGMEAFSYDSMDDERSGLLWFREVANAWHIGTIKSGTSPVTAVGWDELRSMLELFIAAVEDRVRKDFSYDICGLVAGTQDPAVEVRFGEI